MMKNKTLALAVAAPLCLAAATAAPAVVVINEIDSDTFNSPTTDFAEFIELFSDTGTTTSLDGLSLVLFNGNGDVSYRSVALDGLSTDENGFFVFGTNSVPTADDTTLLGDGNVLQNGPDAVALYTGAAPTAATTTNLVDAIVYGTGDAPDTGLLAALGETVQFDEGPATPPSNETNNSLARVPNGSGEFVQQAQTPGANNVPEPGSLGLLAAAGLLLAGRRRRHN